MKKTKNKFKNMVELQLNPNEILEFLDFLKVAESGGLHCSSAVKIKNQLHEFVVSRIEGRNPKAYVVSTDDLALMDQQSLQKLAFAQVRGIDYGVPYEKYKAASPQEIVDTMNPPLVENTPSPGEQQTPAIDMQKKYSALGFMDIVRAKAKGHSGLEFVEKISDSKLEEVFNEAVQKMTGQSK